MASDTAMPTEDMAQLQLLRLVSPALPIGAFAWSQGLETGIEEGWLVDVASLESWLSGLMLNSLAYQDLAYLQRLRAAMAGNPETVTDWNRQLLASRETRELYEEDSQLGEALWRLLHKLDGVARPVAANEPISLVTGFALAAHHWDIAWRPLALGFLWAWAENLVTAATKAVPLGQTDAQRVLGNLIPKMNQAVDRAERVEEDRIGASFPGFAIASARHEIQYSRLFRS
ncbi:urease accessory UreF family protein [Marinobacteraceae bacterium S3BR75-40.1]